MRSFFSGSDCFAIRLAREKCQRIGSNRDGHRKTSSKVWCIIHYNRLIIILVVGLRAFHPFHIRLRIVGFLLRNPSLLGCVRWGRRFVGRSRMISGGSNSGISRGSLRSIEDAVRIHRRLGWCDQVDDISDGHGFTSRLTWRSGFRSGLRSWHSGNWGLGETTLKSIGHMENISKVVGNLLLLSDAMLGNLPSIEFRMTTTDSCPSIH